MFSGDDFTVWFFGVGFFIYQICNNVMLWHCTAASCQKPTLPRNNRKDGNYLGHCIKVCLFLFMFCGQGLKILFPPKNCLCVAFEVFCVCTFRRELCLVVLWSWDIKCMGSLEFEASVSCTRKQCRLTRFQFICWIVFSSYWTSSRLYTFFRDTTIRVYCCLSFRLRGNIRLHALNKMNSVWYWTVFKVMRGRLCLMFIKIMRCWI